LKENCKNIIFCINYEKIFLFCCIIGINVKDYEFCRPCPEKPLGKLDFFSKNKHGGKKDFSSPANGILLHNELASIREASSGNKSFNNYKRFHIPDDQ